MLCKLLGSSIRYFGIFNVHTNNPLSAFLGSDALGKRNALLPTLVAGVEVGENQPGRAGTFALFSLNSHQIFVKYRSYLRPIREQVQCDWPSS